MKAFWVGNALTPVTNNYQFLCTPLADWDATEATRCNALSEDVVITKLTAWVSFAPGGATSWTFTVRDDAADTAAAVTIAGANTTASWSGSVAISAASLVAMLATASGSPAASGSVYWTIEYTTAGNFYLMLGGNYGTTDNATPTYLMPCGGATYTPSTTAGVFEGWAPSALTVTKVAANVSVAPGVGKSHTFTAFYNRTTDSSFSAVISDANTVAASSPGTLAVGAGDSIQIKHVPAGTPAPSAVATCLTIAPGVAGEVAWFLYTTSPLTALATGYNSFGPYNFVGAGAELTLAVRFPACTLKKLFALLAAAPGAGASRTFTMRSNLADTAVVAPIADAALSAFDSINAAAHADGNFVSVMHVPVATPAANFATACSFVALVDQGGDTAKFFGFF